MSNELSIAAATAAFHDRLLGSVGATIAGASVLLGRPDTTRQADPRPTVHLFLYEVTVNPFLRNVGSIGASNPDHTDIVAAVDLHFLLTFAGNEGTLEPQRLLGAVLADLGSRPFLAPDEIARAIAARDTLQGADLAGQPDTVVLTPIDMGLEELSKLWSVMMHEPYALSLPYRASAIVLSRARPAGPPVLVRHIDAGASVALDLAVPDRG